MATKFESLAKRVRKNPFLNIKEECRKLDLSYPSALVYLNAINQGRKHRTVERAKATVAYAQKHPDMPTSKVAKNLSVSSAYVSRIFRENGIKRPHANRGRKRPSLLDDKKRQAKLEKLVKKGSTLQEIGNAFGVTRERARQMINFYETRYGKNLKDQSPFRGAKPVSEFCSEFATSHRYLAEMVSSYPKRDKLLKKGNWTYVPLKLQKDFKQHCKKFTENHRRCRECQKPMPARAKRYCSKCAGEVRKRDLWYKRDMSSAKLRSGCLLKLAELRKKTKMSVLRSGEILTLAEMRRRLDIGQLRIMYAAHRGLIETTDHPWSMNAKTGNPAKGYYEGQIGIIQEALANPITT